jgi:hypothetical protein
VVAAAACLAGLVSTIFRYLALVGFPNDEHEYLAGAQQMLLAGEWPTRDFFDPGRPLMYCLSAAAQLVFGQTLLAEAVLTAVAFGVGAAFVLVATHRLSGSLLPAIVATILSIAIFPRPYGYPKILLYAAAPVLMWAWVKAPSLARLMAMSAFVAVAFLIRHDHGVFIGAAVAATILLSPAAHARERLTRLAIFVGVLLLLLAPYLIYLETYGGFLKYTRAAIAYSTREADRTRLHLTQLNWGYETALFYGFHLLPVVVLACGLRGWLRHRRVDAPIVVPVAGLAILVNVSFLRDPLSNRLPDAIVPAVLCAAWLAGWARGLAMPRHRRAALAVLSVCTLLSVPPVFAIGNLSEHLNRTDLGRGITFLPTALRQRTTELQERFARRHLPSGLILGLGPFFEYLDRCTTIEHRLFVPGYAPDIYVYARRLFAGGHGQFIQGYQISDSVQRDIISRLDRQFVLFVLMLSDQERAWRSESALVDGFVRERFEPMADVHADGDRVVRVLVRTGADGLRRGTDPRTGWPCYR